MLFRSAVEVPFPYYIIPNKGQLGSIYIDSSRRVTNSIPIMWSAQSQDSAGSNIGDPILFSSASPLNRIASGIGGVPEYLAANAKVVPNDSGKSFALTLEQNSATHTANISEIIASLLKETIPVAVSDKCFQALATKIVSPSALASLGAAPSFNGFVDYLKSSVFKISLDALKRDSLVPQTEIAIHCAGAVQQKWFDAAGKWVEASVGFMLPVYKAVQKGVAYGSIGEKMWLTAHYWDEKKKVTVCMGKNGSVVNCAARFETVPKDYVMVAGDIVTPTFKAFYNADIETILPAKMSVESSNLIVIADEISFAAMGAGTANVVIKDPATDVKSTQPIDVVDLVFDRPQIGRAHV